MCDLFLNKLLQLIPFYYFLKLLFLVYLYHPQTLGALKIYKLLIESYLDQYEGLIDSMLGKVILSEKQVKTLLLSKV